MNPSGPMSASTHASFFPSGGAGVGGRADARESATGRRHLQACTFGARLWAGIERSRTLAIGRWTPVGGAYHVKRVGGTKTGVSLLLDNLRRAEGVAYLKTETCGRSIHHQVGGTKTGARLLLGDGHPSVGVARLEAETRGRSIHAVLGGVKTGALLLLGSVRRWAWLIRRPAFQAGNGWGLFPGTARRREVRGRD